MALIGARLSRIEPGRVEIELPWRDDLTQQHGFVHAGIVGTIADSAGGYAAYTLMPAGSSVLSVEFKIHLLAPADGEPGHGLRTRRARRAHAHGVRARGRRAQGRHDHALRVGHADADLHGGPSRRPALKPAAPSPD